MDFEFNKKVQEAVENYLIRRESRSEQMQQLKNIQQRDQLIGNIQSLIFNILTKITENFMNKIQKKIDIELLKLKEGPKINHQRTYSTVDKDQLIESLQQKVQKHETQINMLIQHQASIKINHNPQQELDAIRIKIKDEIEDLQRQIKEKFNTHWVILNDFNTRITQLSITIAKKK